MKTKYLFVCSANLNRSKTAEHFFSGKYSDTPYQFESCGTHVDFIEKYKDTITHNSQAISEELVDWADVILCMEQEHADYIEYHFGKRTRQKAYVLKIPDEFQYGNAELELILDESVKVGA